MARAAARVTTTPNPPLTTSSASITRPLVRSNLGCAIPSRLRTHLASPRPLVFFANCEKRRAVLRGPPAAHARSADVRRFDPRSGAASDRALPLVRVAHRLLRAADAAVACSSSLLQLLQHLLLIAGSCAGNSFSRARAGGVGGPARRAAARPVRPAGGAAPPALVPSILLAGRRRGVAWLLRVFSDFASTCSPGRRESRRPRSSGAAASPSRRPSRRAAASAAATSSSRTRASPARPLPSDPPPRPPSPSSSALTASSSSPPLASGPPPAPFPSSARRRRLLRVYPQRPRARVVCV